MQRLSSLVKTTAIALAAFGLSVVPAIAGVTINDPVFRPLGTHSLPVIIGQVVRALLSVVGVIALVMFVYGGFLWMTSAGNSEKVETAKQTLTWSAIGILVTLGAASLVNFVLKTIGV
jgi:hypothetical protein